MVTNEARIPATIGEVLAPVLAVDPQRQALVTRSDALSYAELDQLADRACDTLHALGVRPGHRVAVSLPNDTDVVTTFHGVMRLGATWVGINRNLAAPEKAWMLDDCGATVLLAEAETIEQFAGDQTIRAVDIATDWIDASSDAPRAARSRVDPLAPAAIAYTSGTTGHPKGVVHSQYNLLLPGAMLVASRGYGSELRKGDCFPLTILNLQVLTSLLVSQAGGCMVLMDRIDAEGVAEWIRREHVTTWNGPPPVLYSMVERDDITAEYLGSLDEVWTGGADCPEILRERFEAKFGIPVTTSYGLSEAPSVVSIDPRDGNHRAGGSGRPLPHLAVSIVDESGLNVTLGETGEICVAAAAGGATTGVYRPMLGYLDRDDATAESLAGGVLHTGDIGFVDADGFLHVRDRKSLMILRGGANVYPAEVERVLAAAPNVGGCAVLGVPDDRLGERVVAIVEPQRGHVVDTDEVIAYCLERLAKYKVPERIGVVDVLPRNAMGKVQRAELGPLLGVDLEQSS